MSPSDSWSGVCGQCGFHCPRPLSLCVYRSLCICPFSVLFFCCCSSCRSWGWLWFRSHFLWCFQCFQCSVFIFLFLFIWLVSLSLFLSKHLRSKQQPKQQCYWYVSFCCILLYFIYFILLCSHFTLLAPFVPWLNPHIFSVGYTITMERLAASESNGDEVTLSLQGAFIGCLLLLC